MVANAWYPVNYFRLSFGKSESLYDAILKLQKENDIPISMGMNELIVLLANLVQNKGEVRKQLAFLQNNVPYRFLRPWIDTSDDREVVLRSQNFENGCIYKLEKKEMDCGLNLILCGLLICKKIMIFLLLFRIGD
jgi:hypothetical protein